MPMPRMLIADDNLLTLRFLSDALAVLGVEYTSATDGEQALATARREPFDLLLLDARMPGHGGAEVLARVRDAPGPSQHAVGLATTADNTATTRTELLGAGFVDVLLKPISIDTLRDVLVQHIGMASAPISRDKSINVIAEPTTNDPHALLDDRSALAAAGGDPAIVAALRGLFVAELDALPMEIEAIDTRGDAEQLRQRLHRLDASAGFCGVPALQRAASVLRKALDKPEWPGAAITDFLTLSARVRTLLAGDHDGSR